MRFFSLLIRNHPLANITFVCVILVGLLAYLQMPREQDPEINFNWVNIVASLPGASAEDVEKRITNPLEDAIKSVPDVRYVQSSSRENISSILVRFREIDARTFDKRINDLRRELQNKRAELPVEAKDPLVLEITTSNGFPTAQVVLAGRADDETLRSLARALREEMERMPGIDRVYAVGLRDPELRVEFDPRAAAARNLTGADIADSVSGWFRDTFAGRARTTAQVPVQATAAAGGRSGATGSAAGGAVGNQCLGDVPDRAGISQSRTRQDTAGFGAGYCRAHSDNRRQSEGVRQKHRRRTNVGREGELVSAGGPCPIDDPQRDSEDG